MENYSHPNEVVDALLNHRSTPHRMLGEPAPKAENLDTILQCGLSAPDHAGLKPWKFITIEGDARNRLGDVFAEAKIQDDPNFSQEKADVLRQKPLRAPLIIAVVAAVTPNHIKTPRIEQVISAGVAAQQMQLGARALGFGSVWLTGSIARNAYVKTALGLQTEDELVGFLYLGTPSQPAPVRKRASASEHTSVWNGTLGT